MIDAIPAATVIVLREADDGPPEILMVERSPAMAFAPGSLVFPGGRVEQADGNDEEAAARVAAIRETIEEAGVAIGIEPSPDAATIERWRGALAGGAALATLATNDGACLDLSHLQPFARWRPSHQVARVFDTRFYLARLPTDAPPARVDATENVRVFWASARETLAAIAAGHARAIFPTIRNLERLAAFDTIDAIFADARGHPVETISPWIETRGGADHLCIPDGLGYPITAVPMAEAERG